MQNIHSPSPEEGEEAPLAVQNHMATQQAVADAESLQFDMNGLRMLCERTIVQAEQMHGEVSALMEAIRTMRTDALELIGRAQKHSVLISTMRAAASGSSTSTGTQGPSPSTVEKSRAESRAEAAADHYSHELSEYFAAERGKTIRGREQMLKTREIIDKERLCMDQMLQTQTLLACSTITDTHRGEGRTPADGMLAPNYCGNTRKHGCSARPN